MGKYWFVTGILLIRVAVGWAEEMKPNYLPMNVGDRWELRSPSVDKPTTFEVIGKAGSAYRVRWDNPWVPAELQFVVSGDRILLQGIDMGQGVYTLPSALPYFDFAAAENASWSNSVGQMTLLSRQRTVSTPSKRYEDCIEIRITDDKGQSNFWTFAPNVGFAQFGQGSSAFVLSSFRPSGKTSVPQQTSLFIGVDANPSAAEAYSPETVRKALQRAVDAGMTYMHMAPKWDELEPKPGQYAFNDVDSHVRLAEEFNLPIELGVRVLDTNQRSIPKEYAGWALDDNRMAEKLEHLLRALGPRFRGRVKWITIGNEVNSYFGSHKSEISQYVSLMKRVLPTVRQQFPEVPFTVNLSVEALSQLQTDYAPVLSLVDFLSMTYYPLNPDFTVVPLSETRVRLKQMIDAAGDRKILFQEIGCPSSPLLNSSEEIQARFFESVFAILKEHKHRILATNIIWMSDIPESLVNQFGEYYKLPNSDKFKAYLATLGLFDRNGKPKAAWSVFQREASGIAGK